MADIRINDLPLEASPTSSEFLAIDGASTRKSTIQKVIDAGAPVANQAEAQAGIDNTKRMTPLSTKQSISSEVGVTIASQANGALASTSVQPSRQIIAGDGLLGGGDFSTDRTINVGAGTGINVTANAVGLDANTQSRLIPVGGNSGQVLAKSSSTDYDVTWTSAGSGDVVGPNGGVSDGFPVAFDTSTGKLIKAIPAGSISAIHSLSPSSDRLPYFTGASSASLTILSSFARTILDDTSGSAVYATIGATQSLGPSGYTKLPNGLIIQWATGTITGGDLFISFPIAFPSSVYSCTVSSISPPGAGIVYVASGDGLLLSGFAARGRSISAGSVANAPVAFSMIATGV